MWKTWIGISILCLSLFQSCAKSSFASDEMPFIQIENVKLELNKSTQKDVEKTLGVPSKIEYFKQGTEEFNWNNFSVAYYDEGHLYFHYSENNKLIRISVNQEYSKKVKIQFGNFKKLYSENIERAIKNMNVKNIFHSSGSITYTQADRMNRNIYTSLWFDKNKKLIWYDVYFENT